MLTDHTAQTQLALNTIAVMEKAIAEGADKSTIKSMQQMTVDAWRRMGLEKEIIRDFVFVTGNMMREMS